MSAPADSRHSGHTATAERGQPCPALQTRSSHLPCGRPRRDRNTAPAYSRIPPRIGAGAIFAAFVRPTDFRNFRADRCLETYCRETGRILPPTKCRRTYLGDSYPPNPSHQGRDPLEVEHVPPSTLTSSIECALYLKSTPQAPQEPPEARQAPGAPNPSSGPHRGSQGPSRSLRTRLRRSQTLPEPEPEGT